MNRGMDLPLYGTSEWLDVLRVILIVGMAVCLMVLALTNYHDMLQSQKVEAKKGRTFELCKLHSRPVGTCPPGSHGETDGQEEADAGGGGGGRADALLEGEQGEAAAEPAADESPGSTEDAAG